MDSSVCSLDDPVAPPHPSRPVLPPTRMITSPFAGTLRITGDNRYVKYNNLAGKSSVNIKIAENLSKEPAKTVENLL